MKKKLLALMLSITAAVYPAAAVNAAPAVKLVIDGAAQNPETAPVVDNGSTLVPMRYIAETLGAGVSWDAGSKQAAFETAAHKVVFTIDSGSYTVDGASKTLNTPAKIAGGSTMIPLRAFAESIGAKVGYDAASGTVSVDYFTGLTGTLKISGSTTLQPVAQSAADKLISFNSGLSISVAGGGSGAGIKDAAAGTVNIGMSSRELTESELKALSVYAVASDGIAVIVHPDNPVKALTREQAAKIFLGEIKNWADVGGGQAPIIVTTRETGSGTRATLEELILDKKSVIETAAPYTSSALI
jgi:phosphate transport system substrate-binding protein